MDNTNELRSTDDLARELGKTILAHFVAPLTPRCRESLERLRQLTHYDLTLEHPNNPRLTISMSAGIKGWSWGTPLTDSEGNVYSSVEFDVDINWAAYGSVNVQWAREHAELLAQALELGELLMSRFGGDYKKIIWTAEENQERLAKINAQRHLDEVTACLKGQLSRLRVNRTKLVVVSSSSRFLPPPNWIGTVVIGDKTCEVRALGPGDSTTSFEVTRIG